MVPVAVSVVVLHRPAGMVEVAAAMVLDLVDHRHPAGMVEVVVGMVQDLAVHHHLAHQFMTLTMDLKVPWHLSSVSGHKINLSHAVLRLAAALA